MEYEVGRTYRVMSEEEAFEVGFCRILDDDERLECWGKGILYREECHILDSYVTVIADLVDSTYVGVKDGCNKIISCPKVLLVPVEQQCDEFVANDVFMIL